VSNEAGEAQMPPDGQWPLWQAASEEDGYGHIAAYVTPTPVDRYLPPGYREGLRYKDLEPRDRDRQTVTSLWDTLVAAKLRYAEPPWDPADGQRIRDPEWLLRPRDRGAGTCIDLSLLFAAQCLSEHLDTYLVMLRGRDYGHVMVAVWLGETAPLNKEDAERKSLKMAPLGTDGNGIAGVLKIDDRERLISQESLMLIDVVGATVEKPDRSLENAQKTAHAFLRNPACQHAHLVDIAVRQQAYDDRSLPAPRIRGALRARIAPPERGTSVFPAHLMAAERLEARTGEKVVVIGPQGVGKSTLARTVASVHDSGYGWFLNASSRVAFDTALAEHELIENGEQVRELEAVEREGKARDALTRLRTTEDHWVIVIDNANAGAEKFDMARYALDRLPAPRDGQLIIATSTASQDKWHGWIPVLLPTVPRGELVLAGDRLAAGLSAGRPLLWAAFGKLLGFADNAREQLSTGNDAAMPHGAEEQADGNDETARRAAALYWSVAREHLSPDAVSCAERMAWLPPDRIESGRVGDDKSVRDALREVGLLGSSASPGALAMHRLFGEAIRAAADSGQAEATVLDLLARTEARTSLLRYADAEVVTQLARAVADTDSGLALWALATIQEVYSGKDSTSTFARARHLLDPPTTLEERSALADCLHASARIANTMKDAPEGVIQAGITDAQRAISLRDAPGQTPDAENARQVAIARHEAIVALLRQRAVKFIDDPARKIQQLRQVLDLLKQSWERRRDALGPGDPLVDRGYYNLAGVRLSLAKLDHVNASALMSEAKEVYETTLAFRRLYYNGSNPITAASINGIGIWGLQSILLDVADDPDEVLSEAIGAVNEALDMRRESGIANDIEKSATLLAKLAVLQVKVATSTSDQPEGKAATTVADVVGDIKLRGPLLKALKVTGNDLP
jgi:energy-coupling factor transporter ATP-binding protein EcfA2